VLQVLINFQSQLSQYALNLTPAQAVAFKNEVKSFVDSYSTSHPVDPNKVVSPAEMQSMFQSITTGATNDLILKGLVPQGTTVQQVVATMAKLGQ